MDALKSKFPETSDLSMFMLDQDSKDNQFNLLAELIAEVTSAKPWFDYISYLQNQKQGGK